MQPPFQANHFTLFFMQLYTCVYHCQVKTGYLSSWLVYYYAYGKLHFQIPTPLMISVMSHHALILAIYVFAVATFSSSCGMFRGSATTRVESRSVLQRYVLILVASAATLF